MDANSNIAAWMISGGLKSSDAASDRNLDHIRALKESRSTTPGFASRVVAAIAAIRPVAAPADPACCHA